MAENGGIQLGPSQTSTGLRSSMGEPGHPVGAGELLEREFELGLVGGLLDAASGGAGTVVVIEGVAGIGKSALLAAVGAITQAGGLEVLRARGSEFEAEIAFGVARQLFEPMWRAASAKEREGLLDGIARVGARALGLAAGEPPADRFAAIHGLYWLCANRAECGPLVVLVDDVQWVDDPSLAWLGYLARRAADLAVLLVLGLRSGDPGGERSEVEQLLSDDGVRRIGLGPLTAAGVGAIVRAQLDQGADEAFCTACGELTGGNPLFVRELLAAARDERLPARSESVPALQRIAPAAVGTSVLARLGRMGADATALAGAVAVLGAGTEVALAAQLAELGLVVAELTADRLAAAQILAPARPLEFFHPLIGAAVLEDIAPGALRVAHRRAAALLDEGGGEGSLARVAAHLLACGPAGDGWVVARLADAAREALDRGAPEIAASYVRRALAEPPDAPKARAAVLLLLGTAEWRGGQPDAIAHLEQALAAAGDDHRTLIAASSALAPAYNITDQAERAVEVLKRALAAVGESDARLALTGEAAIAMVGMANERTALTALRRAQTLHGRFEDGGRPTRAPARNVGQLRSARKPRGRSSGASGTGAGVRPLSTPDGDLQCPHFRAQARRVLRHTSAAVRGPACGCAPPRRDARARRNFTVPSVGVVRLWRVGRRGGRRTLGAGARRRSPPDTRGQRSNPGARRARRARRGRARAGAMC